MTKNYKNKFCNKCGKEFKPFNSNQVLCGSIKRRFGCSFLNHKETKHDKSPEGIEKERKYAREYKERNRDKFKTKRLRLRFLILEKFSFSCFYCGRKSPEVSLQIDHKYPKSKGGLDKIENYIVACKDCNIGKGDYLLREFDK